MPGLPLSRRTSAQRSALLIAVAGVLATTAAARGQVTYLNSFGTPGSGAGQFSGPGGVAVSAAGTVYVADAGNNRVELFNSSGAYAGSFGSSGSGTGQLNGPQGVAVSAAGTVYVTDYFNNRVELFNSSGAYAGSFGSAGTGAGQFFHPDGVAVSAAGAVYVTDQNNNRVELFNSSGAYAGSFGSSGSGAGQFKSDSDVAVGAAGTVYVTDNDNNRVELFNSSGAYAGSFGTSGSGTGQFSTPYGVAVSAAGTVYVTDYYNNRVELFNSSGAYAGSFGSSGSGAAQFSFPEGVAASVAGTVYVADAGNNRVERFFDPNSFTNGVANFTDPSVGPTSIGINTFLTLNSTMGFNLGNTLTVSGGQLAVTGGSITTPNLNLSGGTYFYQYGSHSIGSLTIAGGVLSGSAYAINSAEAALLSSGTINSSSLDVYGFLTQVGGAISSPQVNIHSGGQFFNVGSSPAINSGQTFNLLGGQIITGGTLTNNGVLSGSGLINGPVSNASGGVMRVGATDSLQMTGAVTNSGQLQLVGGGSMNFSAGITNVGSIQISGGGDANVFGTVTNAGNGSNSKVTVAGDSVATFWNNVTNNTGSQFQVSAGSSAVFFGSVSGLSYITGSGTTDFEGGTTPGPLSATGTAIVGSPLNAISIRDNTLLVNSTASISFNPVIGNASGTSVVTTLNITNNTGGTFDLTNNSLIVGSGTPKTTIEGYVRSARDAGHWDQPGLTTSTARPSGAALTPFGLGVLSGAEYSSVSAANTSFAGQSFASTDTLVKYTYNGDADLNGKINANDYGQIDSGYQNQKNAGFVFDWFHGDFDYSGKIDANDYALIDSAYQLQSGTLRAAIDYLEIGVVPGGTISGSLQEVIDHENEFGASYANDFIFANVPEPTSAFLIAGGFATGLLTRRRKLRCANIAPPAQRRR